MSSALLTTEYQVETAFYFSNNSSAVYAYGKKSADGKTFYWYNTYDSTAQLNYAYGSNAYTYYFLAIGI